MQVDTHTFNEQIEDYKRTLNVMYSFGSQTAIRLTLANFPPPSFDLKKQRTCAPRKVPEVGRNTRGQGIYWNHLNNGIDPLPIENLLIFEANEYDISSGELLIECLSHSCVRVALLV